MLQKVFIDTEFTNFIDTGLISIGLVAETGEEFYAEVPYDDQECSDFVRTAVIPLLEGGRSRCSYEDLYEKLTAWLGMVRSANSRVEICFDYDTDWTLFCDVFKDEIPSWCHPRRVGRNINELLRYEFHKKSNLPEHHALNDAKSMKYAFRERDEL